MSETVYVCQVKEQGFNWQHIGDIKIPSSARFDDHSDALNCIKQWMRVTASMKDKQFEFRILTFVQTLVDVETITEGTFKDREDD